MKKNSIIRYSKEELSVSEKFKEKRDALDATLEKGRTYTCQEAEKKIQQYMERMI